MNDPQSGDEADRASKGKGWTLLADADMDRLRKTFTSDYASMLTMWAVLIREARYKQSLSFTLTNGILADRTGMGLRTIKRKKKLLVASGLASCSSSFVAATGAQEATNWELRPAVSPIRKRNADDTGRGCRPGTPPVPTKTRFNGPNSNSNPPTISREDYIHKRSRPSLPSAPGTSSGAAGAGGSHADTDCGAADGLNIYRRRRGRNE